jgi:hypothetical protein
VPFSVAQRDRTRSLLLERAHEDARIVAGAVVGAEARGRVDRWSDLDLTFGLAEDASLDAVLADWTRALADQLDAVSLFDVWRGATVYRVFLLPGNLQVDLSFTPRAEFGPFGPDFKLLFGTAVADRERPPMTRLAETPRQRFGLCVHHLVRARLSIERGRLSQADHWIRATRDLLGADEPSAVGRPERQELMRVLATTLHRLLSEPGEARELAERLGPQLRELTSSWR